MDVVVLSVYVLQKRSYLLYWRLTSMTDEIEVWDVPYEGNFCRCPSCDATLTLYYAIVGGCHLCGTSFRLEYEEP